MREIQTNDFLDFNRCDSDGELIIEIQDDIFIVDEDNLSSPVEDDFEYEIYIDGSSTQR